jgi:tetratricopeptide (TPR) repeat protein
LNEALQVALRVGDTYRQWTTYAALAKLHRRRGDLNLSRACISSMVEAHKRVDLAFDRNRYIALVERAWLEQLDGHLDRALELAREAYEVTRAAKDLPGSVQSEYYLGALLFLSGDDSAARTHARYLLSLSTEELFAHGIPAALQLLAGVAVLRGLYNQGARLLGFAEARFAEQTIRRNVWVEVEPECFIEPLRDHFGEERLAELMAEGAAWSQNRAIDEALKI